MDFRISKQTHLLHKMRVLCEVHVQVSDYKESEYHWLKNQDENILFMIEQFKKLRIVSVKNEPVREIQSASLAESRLCTGLCWNRSQTLLAIVVDKRQIFFWEVRQNSFLYFKPQSASAQALQLDSNQFVANNKNNRKYRSKDIHLIAWSKKSDKLAVCYSTGQILLCGFSNDLSDASEKGSGTVPSLWERFIDNSRGVLKKIVSIEVCEHTDLFVCFSEASEILVMTFDGQTKFYGQCDRMRSMEAKFSMPYMKLSSETHMYEENFTWLAYRSGSDDISLKRVSLNNDDLVDMVPNFDAVYTYPAGLVCFHWLTAGRLLACFASGLLLIIHHHPLETNETTMLSEELVRIEVTNTDGSGEDEDFRWFELRRVPTPKSTRDTATAGPDKRHDNLSLCFSLVAATRYKLYYYEIYELDGRNFYAEKVDDMNLSASLKPIGLVMERARWSIDCSMLAVQLTNGHVIIYRTRLSFYMVASKGPRTAYLSGTNEVTILDYGHHNAFASASSSTRASPVSDTSNRSQSENANILSLPIRPSLLSIGPKHLAIALNNLVRFYSLEQIARQSRKGKTNCYSEKTYVTIVTSLSLNSRFVAVRFADGRLKLHPIGRVATSPSRHDATHSANEMESEPEGLLMEERYFPDPSRPEEICSFVLTEEFLVYCTREQHMTIFSLKSWTLVQSCDHTRVLPRNDHIINLRVNERENKFICLTEVRPPSQQKSLNNVYLYDLYTNTMLPLISSKLIERLYDTSIDETLRILPFNWKRMKHVVDEEFQSKMIKKPAFNQIIDALWDTDGRSVLLVEKREIHVVSVLDRTLERDEPIGILAASSEKPFGYNALYVSQGIVSYQTSLGRVMNSIIQSYDDELRLTELEASIECVRKNLNTINVTDEPDLQTDTGLEPQHGNRPPVLPPIVEAHLRIVCMKMNFLKTILPIYPLPKCREICHHLMNDEQLDIDQSVLAKNETIRTAIRVIKRLPWLQLAIWSLFTLKLDFGHLICADNNLPTHAHLLGEILQDVEERGNDSHKEVKKRLLLLLGQVETDLD